VRDDDPAALRGILERAAAETRELGHGYIGSEHLLLALCSAAGTHAAQRLEAAGARSDDVRAMIVKIAGVGAGEIADDQILPAQHSAGATHSPSVCSRHAVSTWAGWQLSSRVRGRTASS
jgi:hypothetical protein